MFGKLRRDWALAAAKVVPRPIRVWIHQNRRLERLTRSLFRSLLGTSGEKIQIVGGPLSGSYMVISEHTSHAHIRGTYESAMMLALDGLLKPGFVCYDLGASVGYVSLLMARRGAQVFCFEPAPHAAAEIRRNMAANRLSNYTIVPEPVSDSVRSVRFALTDVAYGSGIVHGATHWPTVETQTTTLDLFVARNPVPDLVKIDVEGEEGRVLAGATELLTRRRTLFCCELHSDECAKQVLEIFSRHGYVVTTTDGRAVDLRETVVPGELQVVARPDGSPQAAVHQSV